MNLAEHANITRLDLTNGGTLTLLYDRQTCEELAATEQGKATVIAVERDGDENVTALFTADGAKYPGLN